VLALPASTAPGVRLTYVAPAPGGWRARSLPLEPGARSALLAGGGRFAAVAYRAGGAPDAQSGGRCRVALVDLARGQQAPARDECAGRDTVVGLAVDADGALVYLALWRRPGDAGPCGGPTGSRVVALRADSGAPVATAPLDGAPGPLLLAPGPSGRGPLLYAAEAAPTPDVAVPGEPPADCRWAGYDERFAGARAWRVWGLDATTLASEGEHAVPYLVRALAATPDGTDAFVLAGRASLFRFAPAGGPAAPFATLPDPAFGLAATDDRVFTVDVFGDRVWVLDRQRGAVVRAVATGRGPVGLALAGDGRVPGRGTGGSGGPGQPAVRREATRCASGR
jgi:hypothetical protein